MDAEPDQAETRWSTLVVLGMLFAGSQPPQQIQPTASSEGLLASSEPEERSSFTFPPSKGVVDSLNRAFQHFTSVLDIQTFNPEDLPSEASTGNCISKFARGFSARFHGGDNSVQSAKPSAEELSYLRSSAEPSVPVSKLADTQTIQTWAALRSSFSAGSVLRRLSKEEREHAVLSSLSHSHHRKNQSQTRTAEGDNQAELP